MRQLSFEKFENDSTFGLKKAPIQANFANKNEPIWPKKSPTRTKKRK